MLPLLDYISLFVEVLVTALGVLIGVKKKKSYGWCIAAAFLIYVLYDLARFSSWQVPSDFLAVAFLVSSLAILAGVWQIYKEK